MSTPSQSHVVHQKSVVFWIFITLSFPLAVGILFYAAGYRFDRVTNQVIETSAISVDSTPSNATVFINDVAQDQGTPFIDTVLPGNYTVRVERDGFYSWEKQVQVEAGRSVIFPEVVLFADTSPQEIGPSDRSQEVAQLVNEATQEYYDSIGWQGSDTLRVIDAGAEQILVDANAGTSYVLADVNDFSDERRIDGTIHSAQLEGTQLVYATDFMVGMYDTENKNNTVVVRQSNKVTGVALHPKDGYVLYGDTNGLYALELDERNGRQFWELNTVSQPADISIAGNGRRVTFNSLENGTAYEQELR